jgi:hypothetical protein
MPVTESNSRTARTSIDMDVGRSGYRFNRAVMSALGQEQALLTFHISGRSIIQSALLITEIGAILVWFLAT